jgi:hypothetical protein
MHSTRSWGSLNNVFHAYEMAKDMGIVDSHFASQKDLFVLHKYR